jgi:hypothetical protein
MSRERGRISGGLSFFGETLSMPFEIGNSMISVERFRMFEVFAGVIVELILGLGSGKRVDVVVVSPGVGIADLCFADFSGWHEGALLPVESDLFRKSRFGTASILSLSLLLVEWLFSWTSVGDEPEFVPSLPDFTVPTRPALVIISRCRGVSHSTILKATVPKTF